MFLTRRRIFLIAVIASVAAAIILLPLILTITLPANLNRVTIDLARVEVANANNSQIQLNIFLNVHNPTDKTLTTSEIEYQLFANSIPLGQGFLSYVDVPVNGRPSLLSNSTTTLQSQFELVHSHLNDQIFKRVENSATAKTLKWRVDGVAQLESGFSSSPRQFSSSL